MPEDDARELRTQHNNLAPISQLPPEILADIFVYCVPTSNPQLQTDLSWLNVAKVTSRWRTIALACPDLWSSLVLSRPKLTPLLLERAKNASLVVRTDLGDNNLDNSPEPILLAHATRLGTLDIRSPRRYLIPFLANLEQADAAPRLQCVKIVSTHLYPADAFLGYNDMMWLPRNLFRRDQVLRGRRPEAYSVSQLHLEWCAFPWDSGWYSHLTDLHLEHIAHCPTLEEMLVILARSPALESLSLIRCSPTTCDGFDVELPRLAKFTVKCCSSESWTCGWLVCFLNIPFSAVVDVSCTVEVHELQYSGFLEQAIHQALVPALLYDVAPDEYDTVDILYHKDKLLLSLTHSTRPERARTLRIGPLTDVWTPALEVRTTECVRDCLDLSCITTLHLHASMKSLISDPLYRTALQLWDSLGRVMPSLRTLHLIDDFPDAWLEFMLSQAMLLLGFSHSGSFFNRWHLEDGLPFMFRGPSGELKHAWPALRQLTLLGVHMGDPAYLGPSPFQLLRALLWARHTGRAAIPQLEILECTNVNEEDVAALRALADVRWDGKGSTTAAVRTPVATDDEVKHQDKEGETEVTNKDQDKGKAKAEDDDEYSDDEYSSKNERDEDEGEDPTDVSPEAYSVNVYVKMIRNSRYLY